MAVRRPILFVAAGLLAATSGAAFSCRAADTLPSAHVKTGGADIDVSFAPGALDLPQSAILRWIWRAAEAVTAYYGRFPLASARIRVFPTEGRRGVFHGTTYGFNGGYTRISVGQHTSQDELDSDWMLTHELIHLSFPDVAEDHHWIEEGIATYVEPIARAQAGQLSANRVWAEMAEYMPEGQPGRNDRGLDNTHTWGRTYWGGAMFLLVADVKIRDCSRNRKGLQDALRAILAAGGSIEYEWPVTRAFQVGDEATGCKVLNTLYEQWKNAPVEVDLNKMWRQLGIEAQGRNVTFDDRAPLAKMREAITAPPR
jgi:hypothetical protein